MALDRLPPCVSPKKLASMWRVSHHHVLLWIGQKKLKAYRIGPRGRWKIPEAEAARFFEVYFLASDGPNKEPQP